LFLKLRSGKFGPNYYINLWDAIWFLYFDEYSRPNIVLRHRNLLSRNNNKMQLGNRIYYSKIYWRLKMLRTAHRSSSGALKYIWTSGLHVHMETAFCQGWVGNFPPSLDYGRSPHVYIYQMLQIQFKAPDDERYVPRNILSLQ
jgi:hypothetical protein